MTIPDLKEKWSQPVHTITIGATKVEGGTRSRSVKVGGQGCLPFLTFEGAMPNPPVIAMEVWDSRPDDVPEALDSALSGLMNDPVKWAKACEKDFGADMVLLKLASCHPDAGDTSPADAAALVKAVKDAVSVPLIVWGSEQFEKDNQVMPEVSQALKGERALLGIAEQDNYKTLAGLCIADGHNVITMAPLDVNMGKQINILVTEMGMPIDRIVQWQTTGVLGYGFEYAYSTQERIRLAGLGGDSMMAIPLIATCGYESWKSKEAKTAQADAPAWGPAPERGIAWELSTIIGMLLSGADIVTAMHPDTARKTRQFIKSMVGK